VGPVGDRDGQGPSFGLLLCGAGESGKTTFARQLKLQFLPGSISEDERRSFVPTIRGNLVETMKYLLFYAEENQLGLSEDLGEHLNLIADTNPFAAEFTHELWDALGLLWQDSAIQQAFAHRDETAIPDHMDYFFERLESLQEEDYVPDDRDILRARIRTVGIDYVTLSLEDQRIRIYDVGGQKNERRKWNQFESEVKGVIFCVSFADFDKPMFEELPKKVARIHDALACFGELTRSARFQDSPFFFIANKIDMFTEKVTQTDCFKTLFPEYGGDIHDPDATAEYLTQQFLATAGPARPGRPILVYRQSALEREKVAENATAICRYIREHYPE
jgi:GTPase SAR1 family protein